VNEATESLALLLLEFEVNEESVVEFSG